MTTHYILADDYDRWNPGEPIEDVANDFHYRYREYVASDQAYISSYYEWLDTEIAASNIIRIETDTEGRIIP